MRLKVKISFIRTFKKLFYGDIFAAPNFCQVTIQLFLAALEKGRKRFQPIIISHSDYQSNVHGIFANSAGDPARDCVRKTELSIMDHRKPCFKTPDR